MRTLMVLALLVPPTAASAQTPQTDPLLEAINKTKDNRITKAELTAFLTTALPPALADLGLQSALLETPGDVANRVLNLVALDTTLLDGDDIPVGSIEKLRPVKPLARLDLTIGDLVPTPRPPKASPSAGERILALFHVRLSALDDQSFAKPAKVSYTSFDSTDQTRSSTTPIAQWKAHGALILAAPVDLAGRNPNRPVSFTPIAAYDLQIDGDNHATDAITHRVGVFGAVRGGSIVTGHVFQVTVDEQTDRQYDAAAWGYSWFYSPNARGIAIGRFQEVTPGFIVRWRPYVGGVHSKVRRAAGVTALNSRPDYDNLFLKIAGDARIRERLIFAPTIVRWTQLQGSKDSHWNSDWGTRFVIAMAPDGQERVSLDASYGHGEDSPLFKHRGRFDLGIGIKF